MSQFEELEVSFPDGSETLRVTPIGTNLYRLEDSSLVGDIYYGDIVEITPQSDGTNKFLRVDSRSGLKVTCCI